ncbi:MAG: ankyrin repeat domain-containing protein [Campylobacterales bacterium]|nr:ankyrin repeat domain-containing protein [Campylobacterales bacterium]
MKKLFLLLLITLSLHANNQYAAIHNAIYQGDIDTITKLVASSSVEQLDTQTKAGVSALHMAIKLGRIDIVKMLLTKEIDVDIQDKHGNTPLHYAIAKNRLDIVKLLLAKEADMEIGNSDGITPLHQGAYTGYIEMVTYLIDRGAKVDALNNQGTTPCQMALARGNMKVVSFLMELTQKECLKVPHHNYDKNTTQE